MHARAPAVGAGERTTNPAPCRSWPSTTPSVATAEVDPLQEPDSTAVAAPGKLHDSSGALAPHPGANRGSVEPNGTPEPHGREHGRPCRRVDPALGHTQERRRLGGTPQPVVLRHLHGRGHALRRAMRRNPRQTRASRAREGAPWPHACLRHVRHAWRTRSPCPAPCRGACRTRPTAPAGTSAAACHGRPERSTGVGPECSCAVGSGRSCGSVEVSGDGNMAQSQEIGWRYSVFGRIRRGLRDGSGWRVTHRHPQPSQRPAKQRSIGADGTLARSRVVRVRFAGIRELPLAGTPRASRRLVQPRSLERGRVRDAPPPARGGALSPPSASGSEARGT